MVRTHSAGAAAKSATSTSSQGAPQELATTHEHEEEESDPEWKDNDGKVSNLVVPADTQLSSEYVPGPLNGVTVLKAQVPAIEINKDGEGLTTRKKEFFAIPYYSWANRGKGEMTTWFPMNIKDIYLFSSANGDSGKSK